MLHHKRIKRFSLEGTLYDEAHIMRLKSEYTALLILQMKSEGYVIRTDIDPDFTTSYNGGNKGFSFKLTVYGVFLGRRKAQEVKEVYGFQPIYESKNPQGVDNKKRTDKS